MSLLALCVLAGAVAGQGFVPARLASGSVPERQPVQAVGGGEVLLELAVGDDGAVVSCSAWTGAGNSPARGRAAVRGDPVSGGERRPALPADSTG